MKPLHLPWSQADMPHFIVDINRACNITCAACYNRREFHKSIDQVARDIDAAAAQRRLHTVTIAGGEPTLHPELADVVRMIRCRGLRCVLLTNGLNLDDARIRSLRAAGVDLILLHIDDGQTRPDLPAGPTPAAVDALRREKIRMAGERGVDVGLVATLYPHDPGDVNRLVDITLESPYAHFLLATACWADADFRDIRGTVATGFTMPRDGLPAEGAPAQRLSLAAIREILAGRGLRPFGYLGSSRSPADVRWLCYSSAVVAGPGSAHASLASSLSDRLLVRLVRAVTGRYIYHVRRNPRRFAAQLVLNALTGGRPWDNARVLLGAARRGAVLHEKRLVFQSGPTVSADGEVVHCRNCPDATIVDGHLVPICVSDAWVSPLRGG